MSSSSSLDDGLEEGERQFTAPELGKIAKEQVLSNHLLVDQIWRNLPTQDIIRNALVSRAWHAKSREILRASNSKRAVYIYIDNDSACRTLAKLNALLEESPGTILEDHISFNGIQLLANLSRYFQFPGRCRNCLKTEWIVETNGEWDPAQEQLVVDKLPQLFPHILDKFQFKYFRVYHYLTRYCPLACFIKHLLRTGPEKVLELDFGNDCTVNSDLIRYLLWDNVQDNGNLKAFPNLKVFGMTNQLSLARNPPMVAPSLKTITHFCHDPVYKELLPDFPRPAITDLRAHTSALTKILEFLDNFRPTIQVLNVSGSYYSRDVIQENVTQLGSKVAASLTKLTCSPVILTLLVNYLDSGNENKIRNELPALETIVLQCSLDEDDFDWFNNVDVQAVFPKLREVHLQFVRAPKYDSAINAPQNALISPRRFARVKRLTLSTNMDYVLSVDKAIHWLHLFNNVRVLTLTRSMGFTYDSTDRLFARLLREIGNLQLLEILSIAPSDLKFFCLDHLFSDNISEAKNRLAAMNLDHLLIYQSSILYHKSLTQINIQGEKICIRGINVAGENRCYSDQAPGMFLVSDEIARLICKHRPGFKFRLAINEPCRPECTSGFWPGGFRLEHLEPFASISYKQSRTGMFMERFWEIDFLNLTGG